MNYYDTLQEMALERGRLVQDYYEGRLKYTDLPGFVLREDILPIY